MNEMAGAFNFFTGDVKESQIHAVQHCKSCPCPLGGWHLPELFVWVVKTQAPASLSPCHDAWDPMSWSVTVPLHQPSCAAATTISPAATTVISPATLDQPVPELQTPRATPLSGSNEAGLAMVSLGRTRGGVSHPALAHVFPLDALHKKSCWKSI